MAKSREELFLALFGRPYDPRPLKHCSTDPISVMLQLRNDAPCWRMRRICLGASLLLSNITLWWANSASRAIGSGPKGNAFHAG